MCIRDSLLHGRHDRRLCPHGPHHLGQRHPAARRRRPPHVRRPRPRHRDGAPIGLHRDPDGPLRAAARPARGARPGLCARHGLLGVAQARHARHGRLPRHLAPAPLHPSSFSFAPSLFSSARAASTRNRRSSSPFPPHTSTSSTLDATTPQSCRRLPTSRRRSRPHGGRQRRLRRRSAQSGNSLPTLVVRPPLSALDVRGAGHRG